MWKYDKLTACLTPLFILVVLWLAGCTSAATEPAPTPTQKKSPEPPILFTMTPQPSVTPGIKNYEFPESIDPSRLYLFYLHGRIIEEQGLPAISPDFGEYQYEEILDALSSHGFVVISEQRLKDTDGILYAEKVVGEVNALLEADVPASAITVVGASKGGYIGLYTSYFLGNEDINFVLMGICAPEEVENLKHAGVSLSGNVLTIYDAGDQYGGSCQELFSYSEDRGISSYDELVLDMGMGHGILYQPLDAWITPVVNWAKEYAP